VHHYELQLRRKDGSIFTARQALDFIELDNQKMLISIYEDITESKMLREQLFASQKMEAIGQLAGGIAHDFNNLLTVILGYSQDLLIKLNPEDSIHADVNEIVKAGKRASNLTKQLLTFSRKQVVMPQVISINQTIENMTGLLKRLIGEHIIFETTFSKEDTYIKADPGQIEQVILNLVVNARDAMQSGGVLQILSSVCEQKHVCITVKDTGHGIPEEIQERIFEPFFSTKPKDKGLGLGLSTVYGIVAQAQGKISLESKPESGTSLIICFPLTDEKPVQHTAKITGKVLAGNNEQVMIVEDEEAVGRYICKMVKNLGYQPTLYLLATDALKAVQDGFKPDFVLTDIVMPGMNGKELFDELRHINPQQKVMFMSGFTDDAIMQHGVLMEGMPFINKPCETSDLAIKIRQLLDTGSVNQRRHLAVLMIDDDSDICMLYKRQFEKSGHTFYEANNYEEALQVLQASSVDCLVVDYNLITMNGIEVIQKLRKIGYDQPAILNSGAVGGTIVEEAASLSSCMVMEKTFDIKASIEAIEKFMNII